MYKVFIVEDEIVVREGIKNNIRWEEEGFTVVGDESDGELAYPLIIKERPDILITDIKMPFMDGLELSRLVKKELPNIKIIIISGYSDFSYAQKAIDIGITEYILKPVTSYKVIDAVKNAAELIEKQRNDQLILEQYQELIDQKQLEKRKNFFNALVSGKLAFSQIVEQERELGIQMVASTFCVVLFQFFVQEDQYAYSDAIVHRESKMLDSLKHVDNVRVFERGIDGWAFIILSESTDGIYTQIEALCSLLKKISGTDVNYFGGIGRVVMRTRDIQQSFVDANKAFSMRYFERENQFFSLQDVHQHHNPTSRLVNVSELNLDKLDRIRVDEFLKRGTLQDVDGFVDRYFSGLDAEAMNSILFRQYIMMDGYSAIMRFLMDLDYTKEYIDMKLKDINEISGRMNCVEDCIRLYKFLLKEAIELRTLKSQKKYSELMTKAKEFINSNFESGDLTLNQVAAEVNISPNYFSSLFNQEAGMTFIEYLTELRMKKAKEYLRCTNRKITEIGSLVGYLDSHYFSFIFKKTQMCTPSEYRLQGTCEE